MKTAQAAGILGYEKDRQYYEKAAAGIREAVLEEYFSPKGRLAVDTQTAYLICLRFGIWHSKEKLIAGR